MKSILIVDDDPVMRQFVEEALSTAYSITSVKNGREALNLLATQNVDLVITDLIMPEMDGIELLIALRKTRPDLKLIAISGGGILINFDSLKAAKKLGACGVLRKPFELSELRTAVQNLLD